jgi:hypothetical protein
MYHTAEVEVCAAQFVNTQNKTHFSSNLFLLSPRHFFDSQKKKPQHQRGKQIHL